MNHVRTVRKAVIPVAGNGTRFLPATKAVPKEMLTIVDRPVVQYAVDEARQAGIEHIVFVTSRNKQVIEDHFDDAPELISSLSRSGKKAQISELEAMLPAAGSVSFTRQQAPLGLGHAVWCARDLIGDEPFALLLPDMVSFGARGCLAGLMDLYNEAGGNVVGVEQCAPEEASKYGIVGKGETVRHGFAVTEMVEKPAAGKAPSNYYLNGRYILQPEIFSILAHQTRGAGNEIQLTDGMLTLSQSQSFHAHPYEGRTFDCGAKQGFIEANVAFALARADIGDLVFESVRDMVLSHESRIRAA
ncbi:UDP-glucose pyrophosphorylase [Sinorhizobium medicae]|uniref:UTP--glucose-1-phosphate uridylyltransferase n=1 Tax=Sinorhizobium medicae (strain WSM419) TaxID=366394 RepID=A6UJB1_SINMW|nr:UTP--glucose-1-phosphate uridylyltransferase [Sinorhizobium medicae]ABR63741.1 Nucleotidyl transferase [Sinorhizobium medicae WSM419]MDX0912606.1 UTP--glucose-1-phosphate uridylyltransferase [Sinorhizobium medicae]MDX0984614.1 UTP--glucose-1-phosphate uridylyltransferase [Sinorhizobium medicae]MDX1133015.1 UTP--glucose-1-phosphate uridylyltransferase [Sinorhizobium medicae]TWA17641.1 UDP-glucose pyrophosphorylase [Sinorhizobium medicae]